MTKLYDPYDPATIADPYPSLKRLRDEAPVYFLEEDKVWVISRHTDVHAGMLDWQTFSSAKGNVIHEDPNRVGRTLTTNDPPRHDELRKLISAVYTPKRVVEQEPGIVARIDRLLAKLGDTFDFMEDFGSPLAGGVVGALVGVPEDQLASFQTTIDEAIQVSRDARGGATLGQVFEMMAPLVQERRRNPTGDLISAFCSSGEVGVEMSDQDVTVMCASLLAAGFSSSAHAVGNVIHALYRFPDARKKITENPALVPAFVDEALRWDTPTFAFGRQTTRDVTLHGTTIPADSRVMMVLGSGNRDERHFPNPDVVQLDRSQQGALYFNVGVHRCLGSTLARMELRLTIEKLLPLLGDFELDLDNALRVHSLNLRGFRRLPIRLRQRVAA